MEELPSAAPAAESWPHNELGDDTPLGLQADEMFARQLDTGFAGAVRSLVHDPATGLAGRDPEGALAGIAETIPLLGELKDQYLAQARGPRQKAMLEPLIDRRLDRAGGDLGRIVEQATSVLDDRIVAERIRGFGVPTTTLQATCSCANFAMSRISTWDCTCNKPAFSFGRL